MIDPNEVVSLNVYVNSLASHSQRALEIPAPKYGIINPWTTPNQTGIRAWRSEWHVPTVNGPVDNLGVPAGLRILPVSAKGRTEPYYAVVAGKKLGIYVSDSAEQLQLEQGFIQVVTVARYGSGEEKFKAASEVFTGVTFYTPISPSLCSSVVVSKMNLSPVPPTSKVVTRPPNINTFCIATLTFQDVLVDPLVDLIKLHFAVFLKIKGKDGDVYFFDDPEMDVTQP